jgi:hypothetical protein
MIAAAKKWPWALCLFVIAVCVWRMPRSDVNVEAYRCALASLPAGSSVQVVVHPPWRDDVVRALNSPSRRIGRTLNPTAGQAWPRVIVLADPHAATPSSWNAHGQGVPHACGVDIWEMQ